MAYIKTIKGNKYLYESYRENGKVKKRYLGRAKMGIIEKILGWLK